MNQQEEYKPVKWCALSAYTDKIILQIYEKTDLDVFLIVRLRLIIPKIFMRLCIIENFMLTLQKYSREHGKEYRSNHNGLYFRD
jgi:hypothetical protein